MDTIQLTTERGESLRCALAENAERRPWDVYPRPQMVRNSYVNLNGWWDFAVTQDGGGYVRDGSLQYDRKILVPFPVESTLSGIGAHFPEGIGLCYRRRFRIDSIPQDKRLLLHCDGVDQEVRVWLNGALEGGALPAFVYPWAVRLDHLQAGENVLELEVTDRLDWKAYPYGKQRIKRGGMWYTPVSGIWQTVWLEWVPETYVSELKITSTVTEATVELTETTANDPAGAAVARPQASDARPYSEARRERTDEGAGPYVECEGVRYPIVDGKAVIRPENPHLWTPEDPYLYKFTVKTETDEVQSYFALRTIESRVVDGVPRLCLNGKPYFFHALLDQGYWPDGIYTPADPACYADDILAIKRLGFNTLRKHIKVEPEQFYYDCDRLGMLVMQDMVNNGRYSFFGDTLLPTLGVQKLPQCLPLRRRGTKTRFRQAMEATVRRLFNHPSIVYWTVFNEGWGQFSPSENYDRLKALDPTRVIDTTSGWFRGGKSDVESRHVYFRRFRLPNSKKPVVLSEFGGYSCKLEGHSFNLDKTYGYRFFKDPAEYRDALARLYEQEIIPAVPYGLCGAVYTQVSDVEDETNGLLTYDRRVCKVDEARMRSVAAKLRL